ncbi:MAG: hypothetical protein BGO31_13020 [Bacteroidetes bacterium 43-16]|nr:MAG: hypothetical protein BGO31_13020 [Bacteroidetes bacterium 43-16]
MKTIITSLVALLCLIGVRVHAQVEETAQLVLNIEKLSQFKSILSDMKKGYNILNGGYNTVKNISEGNFNIHRQFLDGLMEASPIVKNYRKVPEIINYQLMLVKEYRASYTRFSSSGQFQAKDLEYISQVYGRLFNRSLRGLDELLLVVTSGKLRMSDDERLQAIDRIHADMEDSLRFLRHFSNETSTLSLQREKESKSIQTSSRYFK